MTALRFRLGSLDGRLATCAERYASLLASAFGTGLEADEPSAPRTAELEIVEQGSPPDPLTDQLAIARQPDGFDIMSDPLVARVCTAGPIPRIRYEIRQPGMREDWLTYHFWLVTNRLLLALDRIVLHAAALQLDGRVHLFSGPKGAGKSTLSVALCRAGATLLAEDHLLLTRRAGGFVVSGVNARMRVTGKTEAHFLSGQLDQAPILVSGTPKKEFPAARFFPVRCHEDFRPDRLFFNRVGERFHVRPLTGREALLRLMKNTADLQRFHDPQDYAEFLDFLADLTRRVPAFDLEVADDLTRLAEVVDHLRA